MTIKEVQPNPSDPQAKTEIEGTITKILPFYDQNTGHQSDFLQTKFGIKQNVLIDGVIATFWGKNPLTPEQFNKPLKFMCKASIYNGMLQYNINLAGAGGQRQFRDFKQEAKEKNRSLALSYCLDKNLLGIPYGIRAFAKAVEIAEFFETGKFPLSVQNEQIVKSTENEPDESIVEKPKDDIPF